MIDPTGGEDGGLWDGHDEESIFASSEFDHEQFEYNGGSGGAHMANGGFYSNEEMVLDAIALQINNNGWEKSAKHQGYGEWHDNDGAVTFIENKQGGKYYSEGAVSAFELQVGYGYLNHLAKRGKEKRDRYLRGERAVAASREYGGDGSGSVQDVALSTLHTIEQFNPVSQMWDAMSIAMGGTDKYGRGRNSVDLAYAALGSLPFIGMESGAAKVGSRAFFSGAGTEAQAINQGFQTLGQTRAGQNLAKLTAGMDYYPGSQAYNMWGRLSATYAKGIPQGSTVNVFFNNPSATGFGTQ